MGSPRQVGRLMVSALACFGAVGGALADGGGQRRVVVESVPVTAAQLGALAAAGKAVRLDESFEAREAGDVAAVLVETLRDELPAGWIASLPRGYVPVGGEGVDIDSLGRAIVNRAQGVPSWSQADVDGLLAAIGAERAAGAGMAGEARTESEALLGNLLGQAISRGIDVPLGDVSADTAAAIGEYLRYYETLRVLNQQNFGYVYEPSVYEAAVVESLRGIGINVGAMQEAGREAGIASLGQGQLRGAVCYARTTFTTGVTTLTSATTIWNANNADDTSADVPIGFATAHLYGCATPGSNSQVRVSSNGYLTFFQLGGGAATAGSGAVFDNQALPNQLDPDSVIAPLWDDLIVASNQGTADRVLYKTEGAVGTRVFTVEWLSVSRKGGPTNEAYTFQVKIFEMTDVIELHFGTGSMWVPGTETLSYSQGIEDFDGTEALCGLSCANSLSTAPSSNYRFTPLRPLNDACDTASRIEANDVIQGNLSTALPDGASGCVTGIGDLNRSLWYSYTPTCNGTVTISTCGTNDIFGTDTGPDTVLDVYLGCGASNIGGTSIGCDDDNGPPVCTPAQAGVLKDSVVQFAATAGQDIRIRVSHANESLATGDFLLRVTLTGTNAPANDSCQNANVLTGTSGVRTGNLACATSENLTFDCGLSQGNPDVYFRFVTPFGGVLELDTCGTHDTPTVDGGVDTVLSIHTACPATPFNEWECNDDVTTVFGADCAGDAGNLRDSYIEKRFAGNITVYVRLSHYGVSTNLGAGNYTLNYRYTQCYADFNNNGFITTQDIFDFISDWQSQITIGVQLEWPADINRDGRVTVQDLYDFVEYWVASCPG